MGQGGEHICCYKQKVKRGLWSPEEDEKLINYITSHGHGCWSSVPKLAGIQRCGKSCRLRWINYLHPDLKRGSFSSQEITLIVNLQRILGNSISDKPVSTSKHKSPNIHVQLGGDNQYYDGLVDANPIVTSPYQPHTIHDQDHHVDEPPTATSQPHVINLDKCFELDPTPDLPPLPQSFLVNSSSMFDNQLPMMELSNSYDHSILQPENYDLILGQNSDHNPSIIPFMLGEGEQTYNIDLTTNITPQAINSHDLNPSTSSQTDYLETLVSNFPSSSS